MQQQTDENLYDMIIVGGGLVGAGLAASLRHSHLNIALIDARLPKNDDPRLFALNYHSCHFLKNLNLWDDFSQEASVINMVHVSRRGHFGAVRLRHEDAALPHLGYVIPAKCIEFALNTCIHALPNCTIYRPAKLVSLQQTDQLATLTITTEAGTKTLTTPFLIGADGTESTVRKLAGIATEIVDYQQSAIVTRTTLTRSHQQVAYERFTENGAIAMLPLASDGQHECATIWSGEKSFIEKLMSEDETIFLQKLQETFGFRLGRLTSIAKRHIFPLRMIQAKETVRQCVYLIGNAAHTLHPIAAQGFNLALYEVAILTEEILKQTKVNPRFTAKNLQLVMEKIQNQQIKSTGFSHRLSQAFAAKSFSFAIQLGMVGLDVFPVIKKRLIKSIIGRAAPLLLSNDYYEKSITT